MIPLSRTPVWSPVESDDDLDVIVVERAGEEKVEIVDKRTHNVLISFTRDDALWFVIELASKAQGPMEIAGIDVDGCLSGGGPDL